MASNPSERFNDLLTTLRRVGDLNAAYAKMEWDSETTAPSQASTLGAEVMATLATLAHDIGTSAELGSLLENLANDAAADYLTEEEAAIVSLATRDYRKECKLPSSLVAELAQAIGTMHPVWVKARSTSDFSLFAPALTKMVGLIRQRAECLGYTFTPYDALLNEYEPGNTVANVAPRLRAIADAAHRLMLRLQTSPLYGQEPAFKLPASIEVQRQINRFVAGSMGFDWTRGRLDETAHPFCNTMSPDDVRLCTRYKPDDLLDALFSTIHEAGHGLYEQGLPKQWWRTPLGAASTMSIHEANSRLWENHVGRSRPFIEWLHRQLVAFGALDPSEVSVDGLYRALNVVRPGFIRVDADEVTYGIHVFIRFEIERRLLSGDLVVPDVPAAWNALVKELLDLDVTDDAKGCLQDVHWACGLFGYFPSYALGSSNAAQLVATIERERPGAMSGVMTGDRGLLDWLRENIHAHGRRYDPDDLMRRATGALPSATAYSRYLEEKFAGIYGL